MSMSWPLQARVTPTSGQLIIAGLLRSIVYSVGVGWARRSCLEFLSWEFRTISSLRELIRDELDEDFIVLDCSLIIINIIPARDTVKSTASHTS